MEGDRAQRRNVVGWEVGAASGGTVGLLGGLVVPDLGAVAGVLLGAIGGALVGRLLASRFSVEEWEPGTGHPFVGAHAPDDDTTPP